MPSTVQLPYEVLVIQALGPTIASFCTVLVAGLVASVAWRQWTLARDKVAIDLFDKRYALFQELLDIPANADEMSELEWILKLNELKARTGFLFGATASNHAMDFLKAARKVDAEGTKKPFAKLFAEIQPVLELPLRHTGKRR